VQRELDFNKIDTYSQTVINSFEFTKKSEDAFYNAVDLDVFKDEDAETILNHLENNIRLIPFGDYLKRYIYLKAMMEGDYREIDIREYQNIIVNSFAENYTPKSFSETSAKIGALAKNWLSQASVNRSIVFLLGFGLNMCAEDVSDFLTKALRERDFNFKDPEEIIYWYCFSNGYKYRKMLTLKQQYEMLEPAPYISVNGNKTIGARNIVREINDDDMLLHYLAGIKDNIPATSLSTTSWQWFSELYQKCKSLIAGFYNADEQERQEINTADKGSHKIWSSEDINEGDVEKILCCGTPVNVSGNLEKMSASKLSKYFTNKRFSRQHIAALLTKSAAVDRFDLITLNFFLFSQEYEGDNKNRYIAFADSTNEILNDCMMGELYVANPYECFLLMCILSDCPLATYADVWEMSFDDFLD
jgi:hypothetical protein